MRPSRSMCSKVVLPALSRPRKTSLPLFLARPSEARRPQNQSTRNMTTRERERGEEREEKREQGKGREGRRGREQRVNEG